MFIFKVGEVILTLTGEDIIYGDLLYVDNGVKREVCVYPAILDLYYFLEHSLGHPSSFIKKVLFQDSLYSENLKHHRRTPIMPLSVLSGKASVALPNSME